MKLRFLPVHNFGEMKCRRPFTAFLAYHNPMPLTQTHLPNKEISIAFIILARLIPIRKLHIQALP